MSYLYFSEEILDINFKNHGKLVQGVDHRSFIAILNARKLTTVNRVVVRFYVTKG